MADETWKTTFEVRAFTERHEDGDLGTTIVTKYQVVNLHSNAVVGTYNEHAYAVKQARRKYKKLVKLMEKLFMSQV
jgi:hypothetical protein